MQSSALAVDFFTQEFWISFGVGFLAQLVDGALGMAYGLVSTSFLLSLGVPPAQASAMVHTAEVFTTGASGLSHGLKRNVDWRLVLRLAPAGILGGALGAIFLSRVPGDVIRPFVALYLVIMGLILLRMAIVGQREQEPNLKGATPLGFVGGFLDASGGGGWGPIVTSTLLGRGHAPRMAIGSVSLSEFLVTAAIAAVFAAELGVGHLSSVLGLILGGVLAAPLAAHVVRVLPARLLMGVVALTVIGLSAWQARLFIDRVETVLWPALLARWQALFDTPTMSIGPFLGL
jgi:hypothetical protein